MNNDDFKVDLSKIAEDRIPGVSGMMRVRNDAEFIEASVESCIDALDELVIVYNDCTDNSPEIIRRMADRYPDKIKVYDYKPKIYAWNLSDEEIKAIFDGTIPAENTLAGYYNFALSKTTHQYVMKIDADQIYFSDQLKNLCNCYRYSENKYTLSFNELVFLFKIRLSLSISSRFNRSLKCLNDKNQYAKYSAILHKYLSIHKQDVSLSGLNILKCHGSIYIPLETTISNDIILNMPYNGEGDHPIFLVTEKTIFVPKFNNQYNQVNNLGKSIIEQLIGIRKPWRVGAFWIHLNRCRSSNFIKNLSIFEKKPSKFILFEDFITFDLKKYSQNYSSDKSLQKRMRNFEFVHASLNCEIIRTIRKNTHSVKCK